MYRKNMGKGKGSGYYNLIKGYDSYIHSLSARGYRTMANNNLLYKTLPKSVPMPKLQLLSAGQFDSKFKDDYKDDEQGYATTRVTPDGKATIYVRDSGDIERTGKLIAHELNELAIFDHLVNDEGVDSQQAQVLAHNLNAVKVDGVDDTYELNAKGDEEIQLKDVFRSLREEEKILTRSDLQGRATIIAQKIAKKLNLRPDKVLPDGTKYYWELENLLLEYADGELDINSTKRFILDLPKETQKPVFDDEVGYGVHRINAKGYKTEQEKTDDFVELVGGRTKAEELYRILQNTYPRYCSLNDEYPKQHTKEEVFRAMAKEKGFTKKQIDAILSL